eukprot:5147732-Amphidinium_carterae.2
MSANLEIDEYSVSPEELIHLRLEAVAPTSFSSQVASSTVPSVAPVYVVRLSTHQQWSSVKGKSHVYKVAYGQEHTTTHLLQGLATKLKLHRRKINLLSRQITYLDSRFSLPMSARSTSSTFSQLPDNYPLVQVQTVYLYVSWQRTCTPSEEDMKEVCTSLERVVNSSLSVVEGGGRPQRVQYAPIAQAAFNKLLVDLQKSPQGLFIEHAFAEHLIHSDSKAARAIFQAQSPEQRLLAFAAALGRAGCTAYELGMRKAATKAAGKAFDNEVIERKHSPPILVEGAAVQSAEVDPYLEHPQPKKRGRPHGAKNLRVDTNAVVVPPHAPSVLATNQNSGAGSTPAAEAQHLLQLQHRLDMLEEWAHGVDATFLKTPDKGNLESLRTSGGSVAPPLDVQQNLKDAAALATAQGIQLQQLVDDVAVLRTTCSHHMTGSASGENTEIGEATSSPLAEDGVIKQDIRKLWALFHRLAAGMREKGILFPEKPL